MKLLEHLNSYLSTTLRKAEAEDEHELAMIVMDTQARLADLRARKYRERVAKMTADAEAER